MNLKIQWILERPAVDWVETQEPEKQPSKATLRGFYG